MDWTAAAAPGRQERSCRRIGYLATFAGLGPAQREVALTLAVAGDATIPREVTESPETHLALARARIDVGDYRGATAALTTLADLPTSDPSDWRIAWYNGLCDLAAALAAGPGAGGHDQRGSRAAGSPRCMTSCPANSRPS